ncbi:BZ3500_MvSof-1268-A1-R1_Chr10-2g02861 [Microbotryum saponariae]|uniref:BZ3500_MvSof-1268-A1-R1_Chr10-2g02861 protein n=1 Tax=Microbotryum saponariae TaxID=289078 RepID=A0A2X0M210_9BASI|nr:BZ3501_MvSof-1269-A2-R1_Chr10-2g02447 [Microbotryum saponariae]SDA01634.1 BZ3500_MvSof-1268-A1-R1_Chr10-2g02861 [Microbotryum saponariae]
MSTPVPPTHVYKASDPPQLHQTSMEALREYFMRLEYYNRRVAQSSNCPRYAPAPGAPATSSTPLSTAPAARTRPGMVAAIQMFQETGDSTAFAGLNSDSEDDDYSCAPRSFPPLPVSLRGAHGTLTASALVDSGSPQTFLSEDFV